MKVLRAAVALDLRERPLGVELRHDHDRGADDVRVEREAAGRRVVHGPGDEMDVVRVEEVHRAQRLHQPLRVDAAAERALRLPVVPPV